MEYRDRLIALKSERDVKQDQLNKSIVRLEQLRKEIQNIEKASEHIKSIAKFAMEDLRKYLSEKVTQAIKIVSPDLEFVINFVNKRNTIETEFLIYDTKLGFYADPIEASGGGLSDIIAFALRMLFWSVDKDRRSTLILDEPFKFVSTDISDEELLNMVSKVFGVQLIVVSHKEKLIDNLQENTQTFRVNKIEGISNVTAI